jgi:hypothetical protein
VLWLICLTIGLHDGRATKFQGSVRATASTDTAIRQLGGTDARNYIEVGRLLAQDHGVDDAHRWVLNLWPPGMHIFYAALFTVFGPDMEVGLVTVFAMSALWALLLTAFVDLLTQSLHWAIVAGVIAVVLLSDVVRHWVLGWGLFYSEGLFLVFVLGALYAAARAARARSRRASLGWSAGVGMLLGASAYVRTTSELLGRLMVGLLIVWAAIALVRQLVRSRRSRRDETSRRPSWNQQLLALLICVLAFQAVTIPWRVIAAHSIRYYPNNYSWTTATNAYWHQQWIPDRVYRDRNQLWLLDGGANTACHLDRSLCQHIADYELKRPNPYSGVGRYTEARFHTLAISTLKAHPIAWAEDRASFMPTFWFAKVPDGGTEIVQSTLALGALIAALVLTVRRIRRSGPDLVSLIVPGLFIAITSPLIIIQYEARYLYPLKVAAVVGLVVLVALERSPSTLPEAQTNGPDTST